MNRIFLLPLVFLALTANAQSTREPFKVVGYYSLRAATSGVKGAPFKQLTHVNLHFVNPDSLGNFTQDFSGLDRFITAAHKKNVKVLFSIGGGRRQPQYQWLLMDDKRTVLVSNLVSLAVKHNLDGIDVDLEGHNIDSNYEPFIVELAQGLRAQNKLITAAIAIYYKDQFTDKALAQYDFVNVMSYDRTGPWRPEKPGPHSTLAHAEEDLEYFGSARNIPKEKMTLGVPFYGYGYGPELTSPATSMNFGQIVSSFKGAEKVDQWEMPGGAIMYYNGIPTMKQKTALAREKAAGIMIWQVLGDAPRSKSLLKAINKVGNSK